jgi:hypothetical protein
VPFKKRIKATKLDGFDVLQHIFMEKLGDKAFDLMEERVLTVGKSEDGLPLPAYKVAFRKKRERYPAIKAKRTGKPWDESTRKTKVPPEIFQQIRALGGVNKQGTDWKGGKPIYYRGGREEFTIGRGKEKGKKSKRTMTSAVPGKSGKQWGVHWDTKDQFIRDNYGGSTKVDHKRTGAMWAGRSVKAKTVKGNPVVEVGFKGGNSGSIWNLIKKWKTKNDERVAAGKKARKIPAAVKAILANSRGKDGRLTTSAPVEWMGLNNNEMQALIDTIDKDLFKALKELPIEVKVIS